MESEREQVAGSEEGFAKVAGDDLFGIADGSEIYARIPAEKYIDVRRYTMIESVIGRWSLVVGLGQERPEQFGDAGGIHRA